MKKIRGRALMALLSGVVLMQFGGCTGDEIRNALGAGARATFNGIWGSFTNQIVQEVFNLP